MKKIIAVLLVFIAFGAYAQNFKVVSIDATKNHYLIKVEGNNFLGVVVSKKNKRHRCVKCKKIMINAEYELNLEKHLIFNYLNKASFKTETSGMGCVLIDGICAWNINDNFLLYESNSLKGLCYRFN